MTKIYGPGADPANLTRVIFDGDSLTVGYPGDSRDSYPAQLVALRPKGLLWRNAGKNGALVAEVLAQGADEVDLPARSGLNGERVATVVVLYIGVNDLAGRTASAIYADIHTYISDRQAEGFRVIVCTLAQVAASAGLDTVWGALNTLISANTGGADGIADLAAEARLDGESSTYYADSIHMKTAGYAVVAEVVERALTTLGVSTLGSPSRPELSIARLGTTSAVGTPGGGYGGVSGQLAAFDHMHPAPTSRVIADSWFLAANALGRELAVAFGQDDFFQCLDASLDPAGFVPIGVAGSFTGFRLGGVVYNDVSELGTSMVRPYWLSAGTYSLDIVHRKDNVSGILQASVGGSDVGSPFDTYAAVAANNEVETITGIVIAPTAGAGWYDLRLRVVGLNDLSGAYRLSIQGIGWRKTA